MENVSAMQAIVCHRIVVKDYRERRKDARRGNMYRSINLPGNCLK